MAKLIISKDNNVVVEVQFHESFIVIEGEKLFWHTYPSENDLWATQVDGNKVTLRDSDVTGSQKFGLIYTGHRYEVNYVLADWDLSIDETNLPRGFYNTFEVSWSKLKVGYQGYEFLFIFDPTEIDVGAGLLPKPVY